MVLKYLVVVSIITLVAYSTEGYADMSSVEDRLAAMENDVKTLGKENVELRELVAVLKEDLKIWEFKTEEMSKALKSLKDSSGERIAAGEIHKRDFTGQWVGFSAVLQQTDLTNLMPGQTLLFDKVVTNVGSSYDPTTGIFTAPVKGLFVFNMDIMIEPGHNQYLEFAKDGSHVMSNYVHAQGGLDDVSSSRNVVIQLDVGSQFWVRTSQIQNHGTGVVHGNGFTTFSGYLLRVIE